MAALAEQWNTHYDRKKSVLAFPDENLVRLLATRGNTGKLLDYGTGSGRHIPFFLEAGFTEIIATDISERSLALVQERFSDPRLKTCAARAIFDLPDASLSVIVAWGVLHYNSLADSQILLREFQRLLEPGGLLLGTLRSHRDTHLKHNADLPGIEVQYFDERAARTLLDETFSATRLGHMERTLMGDLDRVIAHWIFESRKD